MRNYNKKTKMANEDAYDSVLQYLKKQGPVNTFRLARELGVNRHKLLDIIRKLEEKQAIEFKSGKVEFLKYPKEEKKAVKVEVKKAPSAVKRKAKHKVKKAIQKSVKLQEKLKAMGSLQYENKKLKERLSELETRTKRHLYAETSKFKDQAEYTEKLEKRIKVLQEKAKVKPKIITRKVKVPPKIITKTVIKRVIKKVPVEVIKKVPVRVKEREAKPKKFKLPEFNFAWMKNIQQLEKPKFIDQKIAGKTKISLAKLNNNIQQLNVPEMLRAK